MQTKSKLFEIGEKIYTHCFEGGEPIVIEDRVSEIIETHDKRIYNTISVSGLSGNQIYRTELEAYLSLKDELRDLIAYYADNLAKVKTKIKELKLQEDNEVRNTKELHLVLKHKWYDMIASGEKKVEYRDLKDYYRKKFYNKNYTHVVFHKGYTNETMMFRIEGIGIGEGKPEWGAEPDKNYFKIVLGERIYEQNQNRMD